jgi:hypothetical protein
MLPSMTPPRGGRRLSADDWIDAGFAVLATAAKRTTSRAPVRAVERHEGQLLLALHRHARVPQRAGRGVGQPARRNRRPFENMPDVDPRERLTVMMQTLVAPQHWALSVRCGYGR